MYRTHFLLTGSSVSDVTGQATLKIGMEPIYHMIFYSSLKELFFPTVCLLLKLYRKTGIISMSIFSQY